MNACTERNCILRMKEGDESGFDELFEAYHRRVIGLALRFVTHEHLAHEVAQEVFLVAFQELRRWRGEARFSTWLFRTALNFALTYNRDERKQQRFRQGKNDLEADLACDELTMRDEMRSSIDHAVRALPPRQSSVFVLRRYREAKIPEIASTLKISEAGARASYYQAVRSLRFQLRSMAPDSGERRALAANQ